MPGKKVADFSAPSTGGTFKLSEHKGERVVLYFYPKDNTPGCTTEGAQFRDAYARFRKAGAIVVGVSRGSLKSHEGFKAKMAFPFELLSDVDEKVCAQFDVIRMKNMYGKQVRGIERSTFLIDGSGKLAHEWRKVKVDGHVAEVLAAAQALDSPRRRPDPVDKEATRQGPRAVIDGQTRHVPLWVFDHNLSSTRPRPSTTPCARPGPELALIRTASLVFSGC